MNLNKHLDFFDPTVLEGKVHIIGVGAIGSRIAELLVRLGVTNLCLWDFDTVDAHNITNQNYYADQIGMPKTDALTTTLQRINPNTVISTRGKYEDQNLSGYVFLCVDSIELRRTIATMHMDNPNIKAMFDARMRLTDAQSYGADWTNKESITTFLNTMQFSDEEASEATPVSACGTTLSVAPTVWLVALVTVTNFMNLIKDNKLQSIILVDSFSYNINAF